MLLDPFNRARLPPDFTRAGRARLVAEVAQALLEGRQPSRQAALFVAGGMAAWLQRGGRLTRDYWKVDPPRGSHHTPAKLIAMSDNAEEDGEDGAIQQE